MEDELIKQTQERSLEDVATDVTIELLKNFWNYLFSAGEGENDIRIALDSIKQFEESSQRNFDYLDQAISSLTNINLNDNKKWLWALANALLAYCYYRKRLYEDSFSAIRKVVEIEITIFTLKKQKIQDLKERCVNLQDQIYIELLKFLKSEKEELKQNLDQLKSENAELKEKLRKLKSNNEIEVTGGDTITKGPKEPKEPKTLLIVMCVLSSIGIIISLFCLFFK